MTAFWIRHRKQDPSWARHLPAHVLAALLCVTILIITVVEKLAAGGWLTLLITSALAAGCLLVRRHYRLVVRAIQRLDREQPGPARGAHHPAAPDPREPVAVLFVGGYSGLGRHALLTLLRMFPDHFKGVVFLSIAVVESETFKGATEVEALKRRTVESLDSYRRFAATLGLPSASDWSVGTEVAVEAERLGVATVARVPRALVVAGQIIFDDDTLWNRTLHNETAFMIQRRLQHVGVPMVVLPVQIALE
jgi:hypothetical protein